jgi:hypothetical protein
MGRVSKEELAELQDPESWEDEVEPIRPPVKSPRAVVSVAFSRDDFEDVARYARQHGMKTSEFIRQAALERASPEEQRAVVMSVTGGVQTGYAAIASPRSKVETKAPEPKVLATT